MYEGYMRYVRGVYAAFRGGRRRKSIWGGVLVTPQCAGAPQSSGGGYECSEHGGRHVPWVGVSGLGRIRSRVRFGWIRVDSWTLELESADPACPCQFWPEARQEVADDQGLTLVHFSAQPEPLLSPKLHETTRYFPRKCSRQAEKWTSVSPCRRCRARA